MRRVSPPCIVGSCCCQTNAILGRACFEFLSRRVSADVAHSAKRSGHDVTSPIVPPFPIEYYVLKRNVTMDRLGTAEERRDYRF